MRGQWQEITQVYRERMPDRFQGQPSVHSLLNRLIVETTAAIRARMERHSSKPGRKAARNREAMRARVSALRATGDESRIVYMKINEEFGTT